MILPLSAQVASLELSLKLQKLGFPQDTHFSWYMNFDAEWVLFETIIRQRYPKKVAAPTIAELMVSMDVQINGSWGRTCYLWDITYCGGQHQITGVNLTDSLAEMRILLAEQGLVKFR